MFSHFENQAIYKMMQKNMVEEPDGPQMTIICCMHFVYWATKAHSVYVIRTASSATIVT